jgi:hypothetical protein
MKKILVLLLMGTALAAYSQKTDLSTVNTVKPKNGQKMAFEAAYKVHIAKFHTATEKLVVYEIISGPHNGTYHLVNGGRSFADMDKERADATAHSMDLDKNFFPYLEETMNGTYRFMDSLSIHPDPSGEKCVVNVRTIKLSLEEDYRKELARAAKILSGLKGGFWDHLSVNVFEQLWDGSEPIVVSIRNLKDGFKSLETDYYGATKPGDPNLKDEYIKVYGTLEWDKRVKLLAEAVVKNEQYIMKLRKDLSSQ